ncbi:MAG: helix-turn-helix transcriptional regulator [Clostridiales bacterium]|nr:helix-turn-helix transcriptional regulator [Clostridiales bacterium]
MDNLSLLYHSIEYIEAHLKEDITVKELSEVSRFSLYHFIRLFGSKTLFSPKDYVIRRKVCEATKLLTTSERSVLSVALEYGFNSHETFSRAFKRVHGITPMAYKTSENSISNMTEPISIDYLSFIDHYGIIEPQPIELKNVVIYGFSILEDTFEQNTLILYSERLNSDLVYMIRSPFDKQVVTCYGSEVENDYFEIHIRDGHYAKFGPVFKSAELNHLSRYITEIWLPRSGLKALDTKKKYFLIDKKTELSYYILLPLSNNRQII